MIDMKAMWRRFSGWWALHRGMSRADEARWAACGSLADVGRLTAAWLRGEIASQPGYFGPVDVDNGIVRGLDELLARLNERGFLTGSSQAGLISDGWVQLAAVCGYATPDVLARLRGAVARHPELMLVTCRSRRALGRPVCPVSFRDGRPFTDFGNALPERDIRDEHVGFGVCKPAAVEEIAAATQVVICDRSAGRNEVLWPALAEAFGDDVLMWLVDLSTSGHGHGRP